MAKKRGAGKLFTATKKIQDLDVVWRTACAENFQKVIDIYQSYLDDPKASKSERQQALKFFSEGTIKLMKECEGKVAEDFADRIKDKYSRKKPQKPEKEEGNELIKLTYDDEDTGT